MIIKGVINFHFHVHENIIQEEGIEVLELPHDDNEPPAEMILWLDISDEEALSRICIAPKEIFDLSPEYEDDRLANGTCYAVLG